MVLVVPFWIGRLATASICTFAAWKGSKPERIVGAVCGLTWFWDNFIDPYWLGERLGYELGKDAATLAVFVVLALRCDRWWLLVGAMTTLLMVATDLAALMIRLDPWAFGTAIWTWSYLRLAALGTGTWQSWRRSTTRAFSAEVDTGSAQKML